MAAQAYLKLYEYLSAHLMNGGVGNLSMYGSCTGCLIIPLLLAELQFKPHLMPKCVVMNSPVTE